MSNQNQSKYFLIIKCSGYSLNKEPLEWLVFRCNVYEKSSILQLGCLIKHLVTSKDFEYIKFYKKCTAKRICKSINNCHYNKKSGFKISFINSKNITNIAIMHEVLS